MWDVYLQQQDQFLVFFLALVILVNAKYVMLSTSIFTEAKFNYRAALCRDKSGHTELLLITWTN